MPVSVPGEGWRTVAFAHRNLRRGFAACRPGEAVRSSPQRGELPGSVRNAAQVLDENPSASGVTPHGALWFHRTGECFPVVRPHDHGTGRGRTVSSPPAGRRTPIRATPCRSVPRIRRLRCVSPLPRAARQRFGAENAGAPRSGAPRSPGPGTVAGFPALREHRTTHHTSTTGDNVHPGPCGNA